MRHPNKLWAGMVVALMVFGVMGCAPQQGQVKGTQTSQTGKALMMRLVFTYPVVMVNGKRAQKQQDEYQQRIEVTFPENSVQDITISVMDQESGEKSLYGKVKVFQYTKYSKGDGGAPEAIPVVADFANLLRRGGGEVTIKERMQDPQKGEIETGVMAQLILGSKKDTSMLEFRFPEEVGARVNGKEPPVSLYCSENSRQDIKLTMEEGTLQLQGVLEVYKHTPYTLYAPVWVTFDDNTRECLRGRGGHAEIALCIPSSPSPEGDFVKTLAPEEDPKAAAAKYGTLVGLLKVRRVN